MTRHGSHTVSRMRENCTYGSMRGRTYPAGASRPTLHPLRSLEVVLLLMNVIREHVTRTSVLGSETR